MLERVCGVNDEAETQPPEGSSNRHKHEVNPVIALQFAEMAFSCYSNLAAYR